MRRVRDLDLAPVVLVAATAALVPVTASAQPAAYPAAQPTKAEEPPPDDRLAAPSGPPLRRGWAVAVDASAAVFSGPPFLMTVDARFGRRMLFGSYYLVPEATAGYVFLAPGSGGDLPKTGRLAGGARIGLRALEVVETSFFSHAGAFVSGSGVFPYTDLGVAVDVRAGRHFSAGVQLAWDFSLNAAGGDLFVGSLWLLGAHAGFVL